MPYHTFRGLESGINEKIVHAIDRIRNIMYFHNRTLKEANTIRDAIDRLQPYMNDDDIFKSLDNARDILYDVLRHYCNQSIVTVIVDTAWHTAECNTEDTKDYLGIEAPLSAVDCVLWELANAFKNIRQNPFEAKIHLYP